MVRHIFDQLLKETKGQAWFKNIAQFFGKYIREVGLFGISVSFSPPGQDLKELVREFPEVLGNLLEKIKEEKRGLFIALDDINGLAEKVEFANWYKSFVDEVATHYKDFPVFIILIGLPEKRDTLSTLQLLHITIESVEKLPLKWFFTLSDWFFFNGSSVYCILHGFSGLQAEDKTRGKLEQNHSHPMLKPICKPSISPDCLEVSKV